tara:strand:- start:60 stop:566 length:507 start_codon:yes stop_codon:yes gene_type:complete
VLRKLVLKNKDLNKTFLKKLNDIAHLNSFSKKLTSFDKKYKNFGLFITDYQNYLLENMEHPPRNLSVKDKIFEGIIYRLDALSDYKNITLKIYLESQKNPKYFLIINKFIITFFKSFLKSQLDITKAYFIYIYAFNIWIEDDSSMDKTMAAIGKSFEGINKFESLFKK